MDKEDEFEKYLTSRRAVWKCTPEQKYRVNEIDVILGRYRSLKPKLKAQILKEANECKVCEKLGGMKPEYIKELREIAGEQNPLSGLTKEQKSWLLPTILTYEANLRGDDRGRVVLSGLRKQLSKEKEAK